MALSWSLLLAFLSALLVGSHATESGSPQGERGRTSPADALRQHPLQEVQAHTNGRDRRGIRRVVAGAGFRSHRTQQPPAKPEEDKMGAERLEAGPGQDTDRERLGIRSTSQAREYYFMGTRKGRKQGQRNWHEHQLEHKKQGRQNDKRRHGKGESSVSQIHNTDPNKSHKD